MIEIRSALVELQAMENDTHTEASRTVIAKCKKALTAVLQLQPTFFVHDMEVDEYLLCDNVNDIPHMRNIKIIQSGDITAQSVLDHMLTVLNDEKAKKSVDK